ncbi:MULTISPECIES: hypothetical protein [unclassified Bradyrhizobium]|uniref:hypothetical protein n=1 Tax=unclassified Bradyrhizobium TaxID=2631580 RepID=UPI00211E4AA7|nr:MULTISPECIES: hypothetical protein [unclassified Bradyrhizobium]MDD1533964.1 hypothetical protein [Bradyrhizobium sp. WBOS8]MDD1583684.1 hypothetical protein [Bradyrhizobium sp. WBOS4]UUO48904.1 hypothetical protein DCM78_19530 [Bradyrhizobium sp. WBOS04]UUO62722.1 hypothetical protein DCM80_28405 [Bradyrhizobium sp. WBOS08]
MRFVHNHLSPIVERIFGAIDHAFGIPTRAYRDNSREFCSLSTLDSFVQEQVDRVCGDLRKPPDEDADA